MYDWVECECGHNFWTKKEKPQCSKCKQRFSAYNHIYTWSDQEKGKTIEILENKIREQNQTMENLLTVLETYQFKTDEIIQEIRNSTK